MALTKKEMTLGDVELRNAEAESELSGDRMIINAGPSHPMTHGVLRLVMELDGDTITKCDPVIGYLHRGTEKLAENFTYNQFVPYTDRLDYIASPANNVAYAIAIEKLAGLEVPERCQAIRVMCCELARLASHLVGVGVYGMDAGALTVFMYAYTLREKVLSLLEMLMGARLTTCYTRIGGVARDVPEGFLGHVSKVLNDVLFDVDEIDKLLTRNKIFIDRTEGVGVISREEALAYGLSGANLRGSGVDSDLRRDNPYSGYEKYKFEVPIGTKGDCYDRYLVRIEEMRQSVAILRQVVDTMPEGPWYNEQARKVFLPRKKEVLTSMESLIQNFMLTTQGPQMPEGEAYFEAENPKGALGFFVVSKGGGVPYRLRVRGPSFSSLSILPKLALGHMFPDMTVILGSLDFIMGECDR